MKYSLRAPAVAVVAVALFGVTVLGVQASPTCQRIVRQYSEKIIPHKYSAGTLARWAEWGKLHPNYHPPKRKSTLTPEETVSKLNFDCEVPLNEEDVDLILPDLPPVQPVIPTALVALNVIPPVTPGFSLVGVPTTAPALPVDVDTPEPSSILFLGTGMALILLLRKRFMAAQAPSATLSA